MPTYEYLCRSCEERLDAVQTFHEDALTTCPACGGELRKVFGSVGIVFKGSGFYKTDSRSTGTSTRPASASGSDGGAPPAPSTTDGAKTADSTPSPTPATAATPASTSSGSSTPAST